MHTILKKRSHQNTPCKKKKKYSLQWVYLGAHITENIITLTKHTIGKWLGHYDVISSIIKTKALLLGYKVNLEMPRIIDLKSRNKFRVHWTNPIIAADFIVEDSEDQRGNFEGYSEIYW